MNRFAQTVGFALWITILGLIGWAIWGQPQPWAKHVFGFLVRPSESAPAVVTSQKVREGTPIYYRDSDQTWILVGHVSQLNRIEHGNSTVHLEWYGPAPLREFELTYYESSNSLSAILKTLLPPDKQKRVRDRMQKLFDEHSEEMLASLKPIFERSMKESLPAIEDGFQQSIQRHKADIDRITERYKSDVVKQRLVPLVREEVFPVVREHAEPLAREIGRELWDRASLWRFGWRFVYDKSPLPDRNLVKQEWERFVEKEAIPVLQSHSDEMVEVQQKIITDLTTNPRIKEQLREIGDLILHDTELHRLAKDLVKETFLENRALHQVWIDNWQAQDAQDALQKIGDQVEPVVREIGDEIFGTRDGGITPEFARVLRSQILGKDKRWIIAKPSPTPLDTPRTIPLGDASATDAPLVLSNL